MLGSTGVSIPTLNDFIYTILCNVSEKDKKNLTGKYLNAALSERVAKNFAVRSSREEKEILLSQLGYNFFYTISKNTASFRQLKDVLKKFDNDKNIQALKDIADIGVLVTGDREFIRFLGFTSQSVHHPMFFLNLDFKRIGNSLRRWRRWSRNLNERDLEVRETDEAVQAIVNFCDSLLDVVHFWPGQTGMDFNELRILIYLYRKLYTYSHDEQIREKFYALMSKLHYRYAMRELLEREYIQKRGVGKGNEFIITGKGVRQVQEFLKKIFNHD